LYVNSTSCSSTDLFEGFMENSNIQSDNYVPWERSSSDLIDDGGQRSSRPKRPSAARPVVLRDSLSTLLFLRCPSRDFGRSRFSFLFSTTGVFEAVFGLRVVIRC
jgi:hypothetical protein